MEDLKKEGGSAEAFPTRVLGIEPFEDAPLRRGPPRRWLTYSQAAEYTGLSVRYLRNLVSADQIPVYGPPRSRRFRRDMLDLYLTNREVAMRKFRLERDSQHGD